jgi:hypothetical protein
MFYGVFQDIFFLGSIFSRKCGVSGIFSLPAGIGRIFAGKNISLTLWGIKQDFCNEDI